MEPQKVSLKFSEPFYDFLKENCFCEIYGAKGAGKTSILLKLAYEYAVAHREVSKKTNILMINCVSGFTENRLERLFNLRQKGYELECLEVNSIEQIIKIIDDHKP